MQQRNEERPDDLLTTAQAAEILSRNAGRTISKDYVRNLASERYKVLTPIPLDGRTNLFRRSQVEQVQISERPGRKKKPKTDA